MSLHHPLAKIGALRTASNAVDPAFFEAAADLGRLLAEGDHTLVYRAGHRESG